ncbi:MAG: hypothetical protein ACYS1A_19715, partial [Planctomycetota bacterium]
MAKTFVQLIGLLVILGIVITTTIVTSTESVVGLLLISIPFFGGYMLFLAMKDDFLKNWELGAVGLASIIIGVTNWLGDIGFMGFSAKSIG